MLTPSHFALIQGTGAPASATPAPPAAPAAPAAPATPATPGAEVYVVQGAGAAPMSRRDIEALRARRSELSNQLNSASSRREELAQKLPGLDGAARAGIVDRIALLDKRILALESEIDQTGRQLTSAPAGMTEASNRVEVPAFGGTMDPDTVTAIGVTFTMFVLAPIAFTASRLLWKRASQPPRAAHNPESAQRLDRIEQAVDAIAIEVERVSEGQRFMTRLLTEGHQFPGLGDGARTAQPVPASRSER